MEGRGIMTICDLKSACEILSAVFAFGAAGFWFYASWISRGSFLNTPLAHLDRLLTLQARYNALAATCAGLAASPLGSQDEANAFEWAVNNGADVISCSWGPPDGAWYIPDDPLHQQVHPLPDSTRLAIEFAVSQGRAGKGCVITFAGGNGGESIDNNGYASNPNVIGVGACNDQGVRSVYSDTGQALWCCFPSDNFTPGVTPGIWTTDLSGAAGYNDGNASKGDAAGNYYNGFGGTSASAAGAAGIAALVLSKNPNLTWDQVKNVLKRCCDQIDAGGNQYDANGHSVNYGYGRLNAKTAVDLA